MSSDSIAMSIDDLDESVPTSRRPALRKLSNDVDALLSELEDGLESERAVLRWLRESIPALLGETETSFYLRFARQWRSEDGVLLDAVLDESARRQVLEGTVVDEVRRRIAVGVIEPAFDRAFRTLRDDSTTYVGSPDESTTSSAEHEPGKQEHTAMRPEIDEFATYQEAATRQLLAGLEKDDEIRRWGQLVEIASFGEIRDGFVRRIVEERSTRRLVTSTDPSRSTRRAREMFASYYLLPAFNDGIDELRRRTKEEPAAERAERTVSSI